MSQQKIANRLKSLEEIPEVSVDVTGTSDGTIRVTHARHHALEFLFRWSTDHFIGYFIDSTGAQSQAVVSISTPQGKEEGTSPTWDQNIAYLALTQAAR